MPQPDRIRRITIDFIPHAEQRYPTVGDWTFEPGGCLHIRVSRTPMQQHEQLVAVHELIEALLCYTRGITAEAVDAFDTGPGADLDEPGDAYGAPYGNEHCAASGVERMLAALLGVPWDGYEAALGDLERRR